MAKTCRPKDKTTHVNSPSPFRGRAFFLSFNTSNHKLWYFYFLQMWKNCWSQCKSQVLWRLLTLNISSSCDLLRGLEWRWIIEVPECEMTSLVRRTQISHRSVEYLNCSSDGKMAWWPWSQKESLNQDGRGRRLPRQERLVLGGRRSAWIWQNGILCIGNSCLFIDLLFVDCPPP